MERHKGFCDKLTNWLLAGLIIYALGLASGYFILEWNFDRQAVNDQVTLDQVRFYER